MPALAGKGRGRGGQAGARRSLSRICRRVRVPRPAGCSRPAPGVTIATIATVVPQFQAFSTGSMRASTLAISAGSRSAECRPQKTAHLENEFVHRFVLRRQLDEGRSAAQPPCQVRRPGAARLVVDEVRFCDARGRPSGLDVEQERRRETVQRIGTLEPARQNLASATASSAATLIPCPKTGLKRQIESAIGIRPRGKPSSLSIGDERCRGSHTARYRRQALRS